MKSKHIAYALWLAGIFGILGFHRFYLRKVGTGILWMFTLGVLLMGAIVDGFTLGTQVDAYNAKRDIRHLRAELAEQREHGPAV